MNPPNEVISRFVEVQSLRVAANLGRARKLVAMYRDLFDADHQRKKTHHTDLLRAAVVFTHACLEDFLRSVSATFLPWSSETALNAVPLIGISGRAEKFFLGKLVDHRNKSVQELLQESVDAYLEDSNYNDTTEIANVLARVDLTHPKVTALFATLNEMMKRRHQIVHRADRVPAERVMKQKATPISPETVESWIDATARFVALVLTEAAPRKVLRFRRVNRDRPSASRESKRLD